jgi:DNA/RNA endonuclease YhcR with UshA esterase domain
VGANAAAKRLPLLLSLFLALSVGAARAAAGEALGPEQAIEHVGEQATVCGIVASANFASGSRGSPTFLNLGRPCPQHVFTAVVWGSSRDRFATPPEQLAGRRLCVSGTISTYRGKAQIEVASPSRLELR